jgi:hypothetical protein
MQQLLFSDFAPDLDSITPGACQDMSNVYPVQSGFYRTMPGLQLVGQGLNGTVFGSLSGLLIDVPTTVAATSNQLWIWRNGIFQSSAATLINNFNRRRFAIYGNLVIVVDGVNVPYYYSTGFGSFAFQPLPGWPGNFGTVNPSIVETTDYSTILVQANSQVLWSSLVPQGPYIPSVPAQVYQYDLGQIPGDITAVHRLRSLLVVYRQNAFQCATFVGVDIGWDFGQPGTISEDIGAAGNECVINTGDYHYIWGPDDFWQFDGYNLNRIPNNLKQFIFRDLDQGFFANVAGRYDINRTLVFWHYPSVNANPRGSLDSYVSLNLRTGKWGFGRLNIDLPLTGVMNDPVSSQTTPDSGVFLTDHNLYLYDENAPFAPALNPPVVTNTQLLIATGSANLIVTSPDGVNWTVAHPDDGSTNQLVDAAWDGHQTYVLAAGQASFGTTWFASTDGGKTFNPTTTGFPAGFFSGIVTLLGVLGIFKNIIWDGTRFITVGYVGSSTQNTPTIQSISIVGNTIVATFSSNLLHPPAIGNIVGIFGCSNSQYNTGGLVVTGFSLTTITLAFAIAQLPNGSPDIIESPVGSGQYVLKTLASNPAFTVGDTIVIAGNSNAAHNGSHVITQVNANNSIVWTAAPNLGTGTGGNVVDINFTSGTGGTIGLYPVTSAQGYVGYSTDGLSWTFNPFTTNGGSGTLVAIAFNGTTYVVLEWNAFVTGPARLYSSTDLINWTLRFVSGGTPLGTAEYSWLGTNPEGEFLCCGSGLAAWSFDGINWNENVAPPIGIERFSCIWDDPSKQWIINGVLANGDPGIATSPTGAVWTTRLDISVGVGSVYNLSVLRGLNGNLYAYLGFHELIAPIYGNWYVSTDNGVTWSEVAANTSQFSYSNIVWTGSVFAGLAYGENPSFADTMISSSPDTLFPWANHFDDTNADLLIVRQFTGPNTSQSFNFTPMTYIVSNDFGDRHMVYSARRLRPGFAQYPVPPNPVPTPVLITPLIQMRNTGTPPVAAFSTPIADSGFGDLKVTARLMRFRFDLFGACEFAQGDVDINPTGAI